jgi:hypothetical protein
MGKKISSSKSPNGTKTLSKKVTKQGPSASRDDSS